MAEKMTKQDKLSVLAGLGVLLAYSAAVHFAADKITDVTWRLLTKRFPALAD